MNNQSKVVTPRVIALTFFFIVVIPFMPLIISRQWSPSFSLPDKVISLSIILIGYALSSYALVENRYFSGMVRMQVDRGHRVVSTGPYSWMRHLGYAGALVTYLATPVLLDSVWAFIPAAFLALVLIIRTTLEDRFLQNNLAGYRDYAKRIHHRLVPGIW